ncbi:MAG: response regulator transcription factor [Ignavibacteriaceae bacterium]|nr:response regulator transcription factor [Ignavibacteriaceae bacterium]
MKKKILLIEDDQKLRENISEILEIEGYDVDCAENGLIGIEKVSKFVPDLIISDILMPEIDGFGVLQKLLNSPETSTIPLIFLTAKVEVENYKRGMNLGAVDYIHKPFHIDDLLNAVKEIFKRMGPPI